MLEVRTRVSPVQRAVKRPFAHLGEVTAHVCSPHPRRHEFGFLRPGEGYGSGVGMAD